MLRSTIVCFVLALLAACASHPPGTFQFGGWALRETIVLNSDGTFEYEFWSDDGGTVCRAIGVWHSNSDSDGSFETTVTHIENPVHGTVGTCRLTGSQLWTLKNRQIYRGEVGPFRRLAGDPARSAPHRNVRD